MALERINRKDMYEHPTAKVRFEARAEIVVSAIIYTTLVWVAPGE